MAAKKSFIGNPTDLFISAPAADETQTTTQRTIEAAPQAADQTAAVPAGYKLVPESKSDRLQLLLRPTTKAQLKQLSKEQGISLNELINQILEEYIKGAMM